MYTSFLTPIDDQTILLPRESRIRTRLSKLKEHIEVERAGIYKQLLLLIDEVHPDLSLESKNSLCNHVFILLDKVISFPQVTTPSSFDPITQIRLWQ